MSRSGRGRSRGFRILSPNGALRNFKKARPRIFRKRRWFWLRVGGGWSRISRSWRRSAAKERKDKEISYCSRANNNDKRKNKSEYSFFGSAGRFFCGAVHCHGFRRGRRGRRRRLPHNHVLLCRRFWSRRCYGGKRACGRSLRRDIRARSASAAFLDGFNIRGHGPRLRLRHAG